RQSRPLRPPGGALHRPTRPRPAGVVRRRRPARRFDLAPAHGAELCRAAAGRRACDGGDAGVTSLGDLALYLYGEGRHERLYERLGAHGQDDGSVRFAVWAPNARAVSVVADWNFWSENADAMQQLGVSG